MSKHKNKPVKSFEIIFLGKWYFVEIYLQSKVEIYTETSKDIIAEEIQNLVNYLKLEGFLDNLQ